MANQTNYPRTSPYYNTPIISNKFLDFMTYRPIPYNPTDVFMTVTPVYEFRPDLLAYDLYNDAKLWWVFAARNPNLLGPDPYFNMVPGLGIYVPSQDTLRSFLGI